MRFKPNDSGSAGSNLKSNLAETQKKSLPDSPMHKHATSLLQPSLNKANTLGEKLQQILVLVVLDIDHEMPERLEQLRIERVVDHRQDVRDVGGFDLVGLVQGVETFLGVNVSPRTAKEVAPVPTRQCTSCRREAPCRPSPWLPDLAGRLEVSEIDSSTGAADKWKALSGEGQNTVPLLLGVLFVGVNRGSGSRRPSEATD